MISNVKYLYYNRTYMKKILLLITIAVVFANCAKQEDISQTSLEFNDRNLKSTYRIVEVTLNNTRVIDTYLPSCKRRGLYIFQGGGAYKYDSQGGVCTPVRPDTGVYTITGTNQLSIDGVPFIVESLTYTTMILSRTVGVNKYLLTFSKR